MGVGNLYRITDYLHTPSRFVGTDTLLDPSLFNSGMSTLLDDPRRPFLAPFNRVAELREPGKVNLNTMVGRSDPNEPADMWSPAYDGLMHRVEDSNTIDYGDASTDADDILITAGYLGPAWRDFVVSRRGYAQFPRPPATPLLQTPGNALLNTTGLRNYSPRLLDPSFPTFFANPFRSAHAGDLVPLPQMSHFDVDASMLRAHPFSPGQDMAWGRAAVDDAVVDKFTGNGAFPESDLLMDNAAEAGIGDDMFLVRGDGAVPFSQNVTSPDGRLPIEPLFASGCTEPSLDAGRNPGIAYGPMTRLQNLTTTRSGCFAVWITVGFFEVAPAPSFANAAVAERFGNNRELYNRVYPEGYQLGQEINIDTGDTQRFRAFYIVDRTRPVAFKPGEDVNTEAAILLRRRIE